MPGRRGLFVRKDTTAGTSPQDARLALGGLLTPAGDLAVVPGVISGCAVSGTSGWTYSVSAGHVVGQRTPSDGGQLYAIDGATQTPAVAAAPASGSRWDLIWVRQRDVDGGDADSTVQVGVTSGTASGSPSKPYGDLLAGAVVLAEARVYATASSTTDANVQISRVVQSVAARGGVIPVPTSSMLTGLAAQASPTPATPLLVRVQDSGEYLEHAGSGWQHLMGGVPSLEAKDAANVASVTTAPGETSDLVSVSIVLAAPTRVQIFASLHTLPGGNAAGEVRVYRNASSLLSAPWHSRSTSQQQWPSLSRWVTLPAGSSTISLRGSLGVGSSGTSFDSPYLSVGAP